MEITAGEIKLLTRLLKAKISDDQSKHFNGKLWGNEIVEMAEMERILARLNADVGVDDGFYIPRDIAEIINSAFLPSNPRKMRTAAPETIMAAEYFKKALLSKATA